MVVDDFYVNGLVTRPFKANAPLVIEADAILTSTAAFEFLQPISGDRSNILQVFGLIQVNQFSAGCALNVYRVFGGDFA